MCNFLSHSPLLSLFVIVGIYIIYCCYVHQVCATFSHTLLSSHFLSLLEFIVAMLHQVYFKVNVPLSLSLSLSLVSVFLSLLPCLELYPVYLMTFESENCLVSGDVDRGVVKSPPKSPSMPGWWEVGPNFDRCIIWCMC